MDALVPLLLPRDAHGRWDDPAFSLGRRRATWLAMPPGGLAGLVVVVLLALVLGDALTDALWAIVWLAGAGLAFARLRKWIERRAPAALRATVDWPATLRARRDSAP